MEVQLHAFLTSTVDGGDWSASHRGRFTSMDYYYYYYYYYYHHHHRLRRRRNILLVTFNIMGYI
jgi:hypothetical protein